MDGLPSAFLIAPFGFVVGVWIKLAGHYVIPNAVGWAVTIIGFGLMSLLKGEGSTGGWVGYQVVVSIGIGLLVSVVFYSLLAWC